MEELSPEDIQGYEAARKGAAFFLIPGAGCFQIGGADRVSFLQRQTTNDLRLLMPENALVTVLTSPTARILDLLTLVAEPESITVLTLPGRAAATARFLRSRIFFMDKVTVADMSGDVCQLSLEGPQAQALLNRWGLPALDSPDQRRTVQLDQTLVTILSTRGLSGRAFRLVAPAASGEALFRLLQEAGALPLAPQVYEILRIESGLPGESSELSEEYTPLEASLDWAVAQDKGCYTGQEVLARQVNYDKINRKLVGLKLKKRCAPGMPVQVEGKTIGLLTSCAVSPRLGPVALGVVRRPYHEAGQTVTLGTQADPISGIISPLPFP